MKEQTKVNLAVSMRPGDTPVPISNTTVKTRKADGTIPETVWESRWMPCIFFLMKTSECEFEFRKIVHLIELSEMTVLP